MARVRDQERSRALARSDQRAAGNQVGHLEGCWNVRLYSEAWGARRYRWFGFVTILRGDYGNAGAFLLRAMELAPSFNAVASQNFGYLEDVKRQREDARAGAGPPRGTIRP